MSSFLHKLPFMSSLFGAPAKTEDKPRWSFMPPEWSALFGGDAGRAAGVEQTRTDGMTTNTSTGTLGWTGTVPMSLEDLPGAVDLMSHTTRETVVDDDHAMASGRSFGLSKGDLVFGTEASGRYIADDGAKLSDARSTTFNAGLNGAGASGTTTATRIEGDNKSTRSSDWAMGWADDGPTAKLGRASETTDGITTVNDQGGFGFDEGSFAAHASRARSIKVDDDHQMSERHGASFADGVFKLEAEKGSRLKDADTGQIDADGRKTSASYGPKGLDLQRSTMQSTQIGDDTFANTTSYGYKNGQLTAGTSRTHASKDADGNDISSTTANSYGVGMNGASAGRTWGRTNADGSSSATSMNGEIDWSNNQFGGGVAHVNKDKDGKETSSYSAAGSVAVDDSGALKEAHGQASFGKGGKSLSVSGDYKVEASEPKEVDGAWVVSWSRTISVGGAAGSKGKRAGASASATKSERDFGNRTFSSQAEAQHFAKNAASLIPVDQPEPTSVAGALSMEIGESRGTGEGMEIGVDGSVSFGVATFGAGAKSADSSSRAVERLSESVFQVTASVGEMDGIHGQMGIGGFSAGGHSSDETSSMRTVQFDLATPEGRVAFETFNKTGLVMPGATTVSREDAQKHRHGTRLNFGGLGSASFDHTVWESERHDANGKTQVFGGEYSQGISSNIPFLSGHDNASIQLVQTEVNDKVRDYSLQGRVSSSEGDSSMKHLAAMTGHKYWDDNNEKASGKWTVNARLEEEHVAAFLEQIEGEEYRNLGFGGKEERNELRRMLDNAKTSDDRMRALAWYVAEDGEDALRTMRNVIFGRIGGIADSRLLGNFEYDLELEGDKNFTGTRGRVELETKIERFQAVMTENPDSAGTLVGSIESEVNELRRRIAGMSDEKKYSDLPEELRAAQIGQLQGYLDTLLGLRREAATEATRLHMGGAQIAALYMDEQQTKEQGVDDWDRDMDPATRDLLKLRHDISTLDVGIREATADADMMQGLTRDNIRRGDYGDVTTYKETSALEREAYDLRATIKTMRVSADELRMQFLKKLSDPASALLVGGMLRAQLESISNMAAKMAQNYDDAYALRNELTPASESPVTTTDDEGEELEFGSWAQYRRHLDEKSARDSAKQQAAG